MSLLELEFAREAHPVDVIEQVAHSNDWTFERTGDDEIAISVAGNWTDYHISFSWMEDFEALHLACAFDIKVAEPRVNEVMRLLSLINEKLLMGHFDLWQQEGAIMYRQSLLLAGGWNRRAVRWKCFYRRRWKPAKPISRPSSLLSGRGQRTRGAGKCGV